MIADQDRSGWFGASDTATIMRHWNTATFEKWWATKLGIASGGFTSIAMYAGTMYEHAILKTAGAEEMDRQLFMEDIRLRVNLDGNTGSHIIECKTYGKDDPNWKPTKAYREQVQVQMIAAIANGWKNVTAEIVAYHLGPEKYKNFFLPVDDPSKILHFPIDLDHAFAEKWYKRISYLAECLKKGVWPDENAC